MADDVRLKLYQRSCKFCRSCKSEYDKMIKILQGSDKFVEMEKLTAQLPPKYHEPYCYMTAPISNTTHKFYEVVKTMYHEDYKKITSMELDHVFEMLDCYRILSPSCWFIENLFLSPEMKIENIPMEKYIPYEIRNNYSLEYHVIILKLLLKVLTKTL